MACFTDAKQARQDLHLVTASCAGMCAQVERLQAQVRMLQAVGYGAVEADESGGVPSVGSPGAADSLEAALLGKARRLEHELTMARLRIAELAGTPQEICTIRTPCSLVKNSISLTQNRNAIRSLYYNTSCIIIPRILACSDRGLARAKGEFVL